MKLDQSEMRLIAELRGTPTGKITAVKFRGEIRAIKTEIDAEVVDRAAGKAPWKPVAERQVIRISEPVKTPRTLENMGETATQE